MNWLHYLAEANLYLAAFYLAYRLLLANETYNQLNRIYLLFSCIAAFVLPVLQIGALKPVEAPVIVPAYSIGLVYPIQTTIPVAAQGNLPAVIEHHLTWQDYLIYAYAIGCGILLLTLLVKLFVLIRMIGNAKRERMDKYKLIYLPESDVAFSFFNYLFIGTDAAGADTIIRHELVHINQKHSLDILFVELLKIVNWFNPFLYLLQNSLKTIHEYIADEHTAAYENDAIGYSAFLVNNAYGAGGSSITHSFFNYNLLKKRIIMLNQKRSGSSARLKYLVALPVFAGLLCASTLAFSKDYGWIDLDPAKPLTLSPTPVASRTVAITTYKNSYKKLNDHLVAHIQFDKTINRWSESAEVITSFNVTSDHKIADARIIKSGGKAFDAIVMRGFNTYHGNVTDKAGTRKFVFNFVGYGGDRNKALASFGHDNVVGSLVIVPPVVKFPPPIVKSGDKFEYTDKNGGHVMAAGVRNVPLAPKADGTNPVPVIFIDDRQYIFIKDQLDQINDGAQIVVSADRTVTYAPNNPYALSKWGDLAKNQILALYGHANVEVVGTKPAPPTPYYHYVAPSDSARLWDQFSKEIADNIKYPAADRANGISGRVIAIFSIDIDGNLASANMVRGPSATMKAEVLRVIKASNLIKKLKPGNWVFPVNFTLDYEDGSAPTIFNPPTHAPQTEQESSEYNNPTHKEVPNPDKRKQLDEIVIRGYIHRPKN